MLIGGLQKTTLIDFPGRIAALVFTVGCNFRCPFCHNPELVDPKLIKKAPLIREEDFFEFLNKRQKFLDSVSITGGEPTLQNDLEDFIRKIRERNLAVKLDTNGTNPDILENLINKGLLDYAAMDIKAPLEKYEKVAGVEVDFKKIKKSIDLIMKNFSDYEFRTTIVPNLLDEGDIIKIAEEISGAKRFYLQQFTNKGKMLVEEYKEIKPYPIFKLEKIKEKIKDNFEICEIRGL